tara:strand:- start:47 stop:727 length:681 start_codon:yes stop_codon:yes gene_type:complete
MNLQNKFSLKLDWATYEAAKFACLNWHYSKCLPVGKLVKIGVWEENKFIGVVLFGRGANKSLGQPYGCDQTESCELVRIALRIHKTPVSKIISIALKFLKKSNPKMKLVVSFADIEQNHHGGIYQATNWIYDGKSNTADEYLFKGKRWHGRAFRKTHGSHLKFIDKGLEIVQGSQKYRYLFPLDQKLRDTLIKKALPYPKRLKQDLVSTPDKIGGAAPTQTLQQLW